MTKRYNRHDQRTVGLAAFSAFFLCPAISIADPTEDVRCAEIAFSVSVEEKDIDAFSALLDDDARFIANHVRRGREEIVKAWSGYFKDDASSAIVWRPQFIEVLKSADLALSRGPYRLRGTEDDGDEYEDWGTYNSVWRLSNDGRWRIIFDAGSPASRPPSDDTRALIEEAAPACSADDD